MTHDTETHNHDDAETRGHGDAAIKNHDDNEDAVSLVSTSPHPHVAASPRPRVNGSSRWRLFYAIALSPRVRDAAAEHIERLRASLPDVRAGWERAEKLHITLKFLGDVEQPRIAPLSLAAERATKAVAPFELIIADAGTFPPHGNPRVLWLGAHDSDGSLARLQQALEDECAAAGFARESRPFHPHITLARLRTPTGARRLAELHKELGFPALELPVNEIVLMKSELGPKGSCYTALAHHGLAR